MTLTRSGAAESHRLGGWVYRDGVMDGRGRQTRTRTDDDCGAWSHKAGRGAGCGEGGGRCLGPTCSLWSGYKLTIEPSTAGQSAPVRAPPPPPPFFKLFIFMIFLLSRRPSVSASSQNIGPSDREKNEEYKKFVGLVAVLSLTSRSARRAEPRRAAPRRPGRRPRVVCFQPRVQSPG